MGTAVGIGTLLGIWLDGHFGTKPWCTLAGALFGIAAAFKELFVLTLKAMNEQDEADPHPNGETGSGAGNGSRSDRPGGVRD